MVEGCHFLQRRPPRLGEGILPVQVFIGGNAVAPERVSVMSDEVVQVRAPEGLAPGVHEVVVALQLRDSMSLRSDPCGTAGAWVRVCAPPSRGDIRSFFPDQTYAKEVSARRKGLSGNLTILQDSGRMISKCEYVDDSEEEEPKLKGRKRLQGGLDLVKKARKEDDAIDEGDLTVSAQSMGGVAKNRRKRL